MEEWRGFIIVLECVVFFVVVKVVCYDEFRVEVCIVYEKFIIIFCICYIFCFLKFWKLFLVIFCWYEIGVKLICKEGLVIFEFVNKKNFMKL